MTTLPPTSKRLVSFTINVCNSDAPYLAPTLWHMLDALAYPFTERLVAYDPGRQEGKYASRTAGTRSEIETILDRALRENLIDRVDVVPWDEAEQHRVLGKYFGDANVNIKDFSGAPIYQYLYAIDRCAGGYVFHSDSDMLFHRKAEASWIPLALDFLDAHDNVVVTCPRAGPPQASTWIEHLLGRSFEKPATAPWRKVDFTSTRYFLMDMRKFHAALPLVQAKSGEPLENSFTHTFALRGLEQWNLTTYDHWSIHPWQHDENYLRHLPDLIWAVEQGHYPFRRSGFKWDMRTDGDLIDEWLAELRKHGRSHL